MTPSIDYDSPVALRSFLEERGMGMQKKFGQNFLINRGARERLVDALGAPAGSRTWEVGPGLGAMTSILLDRGIGVTAFEIDRGFSVALRELFAGAGGFRLIEGDALKTWRAELPSLPPYFFGNLPYNIAATLLATFVEEGAIFDRAVVTVQKEVAKRMAAKAGDEDYSSFSVLCASAYRTSVLMTLKPGSFYPPPNVDSAAVVMERAVGIPPQPRLFRPLVRALFSSRRKTVRHNLDAFAASLLPAPAGYAASGVSLAAFTARKARVVDESFALARVDPGLRAEVLDLEAFYRLASSLEEALASGREPGPKETP